MRQRTLVSPAALVAFTTVAFVVSSCGGTEASRGRRGLVTANAVG